MFWVPLLARPAVFPTSHEPALLGKPAVAPAQESVMAMSLIEIEKEISQLSTNERTRLISVLISSLEQEDEGDIETAWEEEVLARSKEIQEGRITPVPTDEALARLCRNLL